MNKDRFLSYAILVIASVAVVVFVVFQLTQPEPAPPLSLLLNPGEQNLLRPVVQGKQVAFTSEEEKQIADIISAPAQSLTSVEKSYMENVLNQ